MIEYIKVGEHRIKADIHIRKNSELGMVISHGVNNNMDYDLIYRLFNLLKRKYSVIRFNFSYVNNQMKKGKVLNKRELEACINRLRNKKIILIGKSYGGVLSIRIAYEHKQDILKVIVLGYPLHRYSNSNKIYGQKFLKKKLPVTFIIGDKDPYCNLEAFKRLLPEYKLYLIKNSDHSYDTLGIGSKEKNEDKVLSIILKELKNLQN